MTEFKTLHYYRDATGQWRWNLKANNNEIVSESGESYRHKADAVRIAETLFGTTVQYVTDEDDA